MKINKCIIESVRDIGIWFWDRTQGEITNSLVLSTGFDGIRLTGEANVDIVDNIIHQSNMHGIVCGDRSKSMIERNRVLQCKGQCTGREYT